MKHKQGDKVLHHYQSYYVGGLVNHSSYGYLLAVTSKDIYDKLGSDYVFHQTHSYDRVDGDRVWTLIDITRVTPDTPFYRFTTAVLGTSNASKLYNLSFREILSDIFNDERLGRALSCLGDLFKFIAGVFAFLTIFYSMIGIMAMVVCFLVSLFFVVSAYFAGNLRDYLEEGRFSEH